MEPKVWIYIIVILIYAVRWVMKKASQNAENPPASTPPRQRQNETPKDSGKRHLTFEELLKEITESKNAQPVTVDVAKNRREVAEDLEEIAQKNETPQRVYREYELSKIQAFNRRSLEETTKLDDTDVRFGKFQAFKMEDDRNVILEEYIRDFQDPEGFKKAFVMSEILKTKF